MEEPYAIIHIARVQAGEFGPKLNPYFVLSIKEKKFEVSSQHPTKCLWEDVGSMNITDEKDLKGDVKIIFYSKSKWNKNKYLGEAQIPITQALQLASHYPLNSQSSNAYDVIPPPPPIELTLINEKKKKKDPEGEFPTYNCKIHLEITGPKLLNVMINDQDTRMMALSNLIYLAQSKTTKKSKTVHNGRNLAIDK
eukprot:TRINITY_DN9752_c0_g1_i1.p1 TRINITY_DN9752_c0_g1~~TRINITY_DN9752_c0_g1_i1.p1  ORF type:complete len:195 (-),score=48.26 TRINITY_DN9752_c0_g1_i1:271-855(-)